LRLLGDLVAALQADHVAGMRWYSILASIVMLAGLATCAPTAAPRYGYGYGAWPDAYFCCGSSFERTGRFHRFHAYRGFAFHGGFGGFHGRHR
jgi:hypothetical protein